MPITLKNSTLRGEPLEATYLPDQGMNMISFKKGGLEVIDQSTREIFEERFAGLGALIGPHFHHRKTASLPKIKDEALFPHIARVKAKGIHDPFSHGIARYAPWKAESKDHGIRAFLTGKDVWKGVSLSELEGQNFKMNFDVELLQDGLHLDLSIVSDTDSLVGLHYYYHLPEGKGKIISEVQDFVIDHDERKKIPPLWNFSEQHQLIYPLDQDTDCTFFPFSNPLEGSILLDAGLYRLRMKYSCISQENSWQLYHPLGASFVCIEPLSAQDPRHPNLTVSSLHIHLQIID